MRRTRAVLALAAVLLAAAPARAAEFYAGKEITILVGFTAGGVYDSTARLFARYLGEALPGAPGVVVRNMPGSGSIVAANYLWNTAPKDGTVLAIVGGGIVLEPLLGNAQARFDPNRFAWIGGRTREVNLCVVWHTVPVRTIADARTRQVVVGSTGPGSRTISYPKALNELAGTRFKPVLGYPGGNEITLAMEKGEVDGYCGWAWGSIKSRAPDWVRDQKIVPLAQFALAKALDLPEVPLATDFARNDTDRAAIAFLAADSVLSWPLVAPPDLPPERVVELRAAFARMTADPRFRADAERQALEVDPVSGEEMAALIAKLYRTSPEVLERVKGILAAK